MIATFNSNSYVGVSGAVMLVGMEQRSAPFQSRNSGPKVGSIGKSRC